MIVVLQTCYNSIKLLKMIRLEITVHLGLQHQNLAKLTAAAMIKAAVTLQRIAMLQHLCL